MNKDRQPQRTSLMRIRRGFVFAALIAATAAVAASATFSVSDVTVDISGTVGATAEFTVTRTGDLSAPAEVGYTTFGGTADASNTPTTGTLTIPAGSATAQFPVQVKPSNAGPPSQQFKVALLGVGGVGPLPMFGAPLNSTRYLEEGPLVAADFNGDGQTDIAWAIAGTGIRVLLSPGFSNPTLVSSAPCNCYLANTAVGADFNGDGKPDIATLNNNGILISSNTTVTGATTPVFAAPLAFTLPFKPIAMATGDFNGDGKPDLAVLQASGVAVLLNATPANAASPSFSGATTFVVSSGFANSAYITVADLNGDGKPDIALAPANDNGFLLLVNKTVVGASAPNFLMTNNNSFGGEVQGLSAADFNGDGKLDLCTGKKIYFNTTASGSDAFNFSKSQSIGGGVSGGNAFFVADFNADGKPDVLLRTANGASLMANITPPGATTAQFSAGYIVGSTDKPDFMAVGNFAGDGRVGLATINPVYLDILPNITPAGMVTAGGPTITGTGTINVHPSPDSMPDAFTFTQVRYAVPGTLYSSNAITVTGTNIPSAISIDSAGQYSINGGPFTSAAGSVNPADKVTVHIRAAPSYNAQVYTTLTIGGVSGTFYVAAGPQSTAQPAPTNVVATPSSNNSVRLDWTPASGATLYVVYAGTIAGGESVSASASSTGSSAMATGLTSGTQYYFVVKAYSSGSGYSAASNEASATPLTGSGGSGGSGGGAVSFVSLAFLLFAAMMRRMKSSRPA